jgi:hypothetical protein
MPMPTPIDRECFLKALAKRFPEVAANISDIEAGLLQPEMGVVSIATRNAIGENDWQTVAAHFEFIAELFAGGSEAIRNAVCVSYLENILLGETEPQFARARSMLPHVLSEGMAELEAHFERLSRASRTGA